MKSYKRIIFNIDHKLFFSHHPSIIPGENEVMIELIYAGVCGTDLQILRRERQDYTAILGHEGIGEIKLIGKNIKDFHIGQKVVFNPVNINNQNEILGHTIPGLFQEQFLATNKFLKRKQIIPVPNKLPLICGPIVEPLATVIYGQSLTSRNQNPKTIAIVGAGPIGILHALLAKLKNGIKIFLIHNENKRISLIINKGIVNKDEILKDSPNIDKAVLKLNNNRGVDVVHLCTSRHGSLPSLIKALRYIKDGGIINMVGGIQDNDTIEDFSGVKLNKIRKSNICGQPIRGNIFEYKTIYGKKILLTGHRGTSSEHLIQATNLLIQYPELFMQIVTHIVSLNSTKLLLEELIYQKKSKMLKNEFIKAIIDFNSNSESILDFNIKNYL